MEQQREPRRALHQGADRRTAQAEDEITFPVPRHRPISRFRRAFADQDLGTNEGFAPPAAARSWYAQRPSGAQAGGQFAAQCPPALNVKRLVDGLVTDAHRRLVGKVEPQAMSNLLRAP